MQFSKIKRFVKDTSDVITKLLMAYSSTKFARL